MKAENDKISPDKAKKIAEGIVENVKKDKHKTCEDYLKKYKRIINSGLPFHEFVVRRQYKKASYYAYKAAYQFGLALTILQSHSLWKNYCDEDNEKARDHSDLMDDFSRKLVDLKSDYAIRHLHENVQSQYQGERPKAVGHRRNIIGLPKNWRETVLEELSRTKNRHYVHAIVAMLTGCRPHELLNGVTIKYKGIGLLEFIIRGAKVTNRSGQPSRSLLIDCSESRYATILEEFFKSKDSREIRVRINSKDSFQKAITRAAKRVGFKKVSPYSFRNQFSADLKAGGWDRVSIAIALGHINDRTQQVYGAVNQGKGSNGLIEASADRPVKEVSGSGVDIENRSGNTLDSKIGAIFQNQIENFRPS